MCSLGCISGLHYVKSRFTERTTQARKEKAVRKTEFYIIRHSETLLNSLGRAQGWVDSPLTDNGIQTAYLLKKALGNISFSAAYSSDFKRAYDTAKIIFDNQNGVIQDRRLREWCLGRFEAERSSVFVNEILDKSKLKAEELNAHLPEICEIINRSDSTGMAEPFTEITNRLLGFFTDTGKQFYEKGGGKILVVTHAFALKTILHIFAYDELQNVRKISNASVTVLRFNGKDFHIGAVNKSLF